jgi:hypothetical protein
MPTALQEQRKSRHAPCKMTVAGATAESREKSGAGEDGGATGGEEIGGVLRDVAVAADGVAGDEEFCAGADDIGDGFQGDAAIHFNAEIKCARFAGFGEASHFVERVVDEFLAAEAGVHGHDEDMVDDVENVVESVDRSGGIDDDAGFAAIGLDEMESAVKMDAGFLVDGNPVGAGFGEGGDELIGIFDH